LSLSLLILSSLCLLLVSTFLVTDANACAESPKLVIKKTIYQTEITVGNPLTVIYQIFNIGTGTAYNLHFTDDHWNEENFELVSGQFETDLDSKLAPGSNTTYTLVLIPKTSGEIFTGGAIIKYRASTTSDHYQICHSTGGSLDVIEPEESDRRASAAFRNTVFRIILYAMLPGGALGFYYVFIHQSSSSFSFSSGSALSSDARKKMSRKELKAHTRAEREEQWKLKMELKREQAEKKASKKQSHATSSGSAGKIKNKGGDKKEKKGKEHQHQQEIKEAGDDFKLN